MAMHALALLATVKYVNDKFESLVQDNWGFSVRGSPS